MSTINAKFLARMESIPPKAQTFMVNAGVWPCCFNCKFWTHCRAPKPETGTCDRYKVVPPLNVILYGCDDWEYSIPF